MGFGDYIRKRREDLQVRNSGFSLRKMAGRIGIQPTYLSKIERGEFDPPSEQTIRAIAKELDEDQDVLLAMGGKVSSDLQEIIRKRPQVFANLLRELKQAPDHAILRVVREVRDGEW
ncbi:helix-turn-helix transcriptional regulator [Nordella sp. HKS 07]|uniref:helix-turn-helix domain-containing protein n=1 Tax=Nordella sp. HKS 07 TaxID=2712222 RepID=UPI0013E13121|nr:helix-turn-helix transcriptional regulator [Nordella sp. HKS 07]QIG49465.1 helix-turn-helix transcriptional regulator [Nordella sp. HKS 07]